MPLYKLPVLHSYVGLDSPRIIIIGYLTKYSRNRISYITLDHTLYSINYSIFLFVYHNCKEKEIDLNFYLLQVMVAKVSSLLKTIKYIEFEARRGVQSLQNAIDSINADLQICDSDALPKIMATPQDLIRSTWVKN